MGTGKRNETNPLPAENNRPKRQNGQSLWWTNKTRSPCQTLDRNESGTQAHAAHHGRAYQPPRCRHGRMAGTIPIQSHGHPASCNARPIFPR